MIRGLTKKKPVGSISGHPSPWNLAFFSLQDWEPDHLGHLKINLAFSQQWARPDVRSIQKNCWSRSLATSADKRFEGPPCIFAGLLPASWFSTPLLLLEMYIYIHINISFPERQWSSATGSSVWSCRICYEGISLGRGAETVYSGHHLVNKKIAQLPETHEISFPIFSALK